MISDLRKPKILDMAIFDWVGTFAGAYIVSKIFDFNLMLTFLTLIIIGILIHYILGVNTMFGYYLGLNEKPIRE